MELKKQLGKKIQQIRKNAGITQDKLAELIKIDPKSVSKIENGINYPAPETLTSIANVLGVQIYEFFVFEQMLPAAQMKNEIIDAISKSDKTLVYLYHLLKIYNPG